MTSHTTKEFRRLFRQLSKEVQAAAHKSYRLWSANPQHNPASTSQSRQSGKRAPIEAGKITDYHHTASLLAYSSTSSEAAVELTGTGKV